MHGGTIAMDCSKCGVSSANRRNPVELDIPFSCPECGGIWFPIRPIRDLVYLWPVIPETYLEHGEIVIPPQYREFEKKGFGYLLRSGKGYWNSKGRFFPNPPDYIPGSFIFYDKDVPWIIPIKCDDGREVDVTLCGCGDVKAIIDKVPA